MSTFEVLKKTYIFVIIRFIIVCLTLFPIIFVVIHYVNFLINFFDLGYTSGVVRYVFVGCFAYIGFLIGWFLFSFLRRTLLFYVKAAHVIAITKLAVDDVPAYVVHDENGEEISKTILVGELTRESIGEMFKRFISVNIFYIADGLVIKGLHEVGNALMTQEILPALKTNNILTKFLGKTIKTTLSYSDEIVLSYVFYRCRFNDLYAEDSKSKKKTAKSRKANVKLMLQYVVEGICFYVKGCLPLIKSAFVTVLAAEIFTIITSILVVIVLVVIYSSHFLQLVIALIAVKVIFEILSYTFLEPYETAALVSKFYDILADDSVEMDTEGTKSKLAGMSATFKDLAGKAFGKSDDQTSSTSGSFFDENLVDLAKSELNSVYTEEDELIDETNSE